MSYPVYSYKEYLGEEFPFRIRTRTLDSYNTRIHAHEHFQLTYVASGSCEHRIREKRAFLVKGDFFAIPPYLEHHLLLREGYPFELVEIDFMPFIINENLQDLSRMEHFFDFAYIQPWVSMENELLPKLNFAPDSQRQVEALIDSMRKEFSAGEEDSRLSIKADLLKLLVIAGREFRTHYRGTKEHSTISIHREAFYEVISYMETHFAEELRLDAVAERAYMSASYFSSIFKLVKGKGFVEHLNDIRLAKGAELLKETTDSITDISLKVGFNNIGHFNRMFKKNMGVTPSQYRKLSRL